MKKGTKKLMQKETIIQKTGLSYLGFIFPYLPPGIALRMVMLDSHWMMVGQNIYRRQIKFTFLPQALLLQKVS